MTLNKLDFGPHTIFLTISRYPVEKHKFKVTNWTAYNKTLINRCPLIFWIDESLIQIWHDEPKRFHGCVDNIILS